AAARRTSRANATAAPSTTGTASTGPRSATTHPTTATTATAPTTRPVHHPRAAVGCGTVRHCSPVTAAACASQNTVTAAGTACSDRSTPTSANNPAIGPTTAPASAPAATSAHAGAGCGTRGAGARRSSHPVRRSPASTSASPTASSPHHTAGGTAGCAGPSSGSNPGGEYREAVTPAPTITNTPAAVPATQGPTRGRDDVTRGAYIAPSTGSNASSAAPTSLASRPSGLVSMRVPPTARLTRLRSCTRARTWSTTAGGSAVNRSPSTTRSGAVTLTTVTRPVASH